MLGFRTANRITTITTPGPALTPPEVADLAATGARIRTSLDQVFPKTGPDHDRSAEMTEPHRLPVDVLILLQRPDGRILLTKRAGSIYLAGSWAVPGGKVDADEDVVTAAIRELHEETGVTVTHDQLTFIGVTHHRPPHHDSRIGFGFLATAWTSEPRNVEPDKCSQLA